MSLLGTIQQSSASLQVAQVGLQVVGNNIANANTPGYIRQTLQQVSAVATREGNLILGQGVRPLGIVQSIDRALAERMMHAQSSMAGSQTLQRAYNQLEELVTDLDNTGLNQQFSLFNNALHELSTQPGDASLRDFVIMQGETLAARLRQTRQETLARRELWNDDLQGMSDQINRLIERIARANLEIATIEGGGLIHSDAAGLRDQRLRDLEELSKYIKINVQEQESGAVAVFVGGDYLVSNGIHREVYSAYNAKTRGNEIRIVETDSPLQTEQGELASTMIARDQIFSDYVGRLDRIASSLIRAMNEVHSQGQGRRGYRELVSSVPLDPGSPLDQAGFQWPPSNGSFELQLVDDNGKLRSNHTITVRMLGGTDDSTVHSIVNQINAIDGMEAIVNAEGRIKIATNSPGLSFTFGEDSSGFLSAAGINTFFVGESASDIAVNEMLVRDSDFLAISAGGVGADTEVLTQLVDLVGAPLEYLDGRSIQQAYIDLVAQLGQRAGLQQSETEGLQNFYATLQGEHLSITGVNIDEESIRMITLQRTFQASSRVISTAVEMLDLLLEI